MQAHPAKTVSVKLDSNTRDRIHLLAEAKNRTPHWVMRQAIEQYVDREEKREAFRQETRKAWEEYQETGLYATADEVMSWLETWGDANEKMMPPCHR